MRGLASRSWLKPADTGKILGASRGTVYPYLSISLK